MALQPSRDMIETDQVNSKPTDESTPSLMDEIGDDDLRTFPFIGEAQTLLEHQRWAAHPMLMRRRFA